MKRKIALWLSIMLISMNCLPVMTAYADGNAVDVETGTTEDALTTHVVTTGDDSDLEVTKNYKINVPVDTKETVVPITLDQKGVLYTTSDFAEKESSQYLYLYFYSDAECTTEIDYTSYNGEVEIPQKGTYYVKFEVKDYSDNEPTDGYQIDFSSKFISGENTTLSDNVWVCTAYEDSKHPIYYKVNTTKSGNIAIDTDSEFSCNVTLLNSNKRVISEDVYSHEDKVCFAVEKGTYYIKVVSYSDLLRLKYHFTAITDTSGSSKTKAKKLTAGKTYTGYISATNKKGASDWYKIVLTKSQEVDITFTGSVSSGEIELEFSGNGIGGSINRSIEYVDTDASFQPRLWTSSKLPKGTYYIKITKNTSETSGYYKLKLNK